MGGDRFRLMILDDEADYVRIDVLHDDSFACRARYGDGAFARSDAYAVIDLWRCIVH